MKKLLLFSFVLFVLSCNKEANTESVQFVKDFQSFNKANPEYTLEKSIKTDLESRGRESTDCCGMFSVLLPHNHGIEIHWFSYADNNPPMKFIHLLYYNPTAPVFGAPQMYFMFQGTPDPCSPVNTYNLSIGAAQPGYYRLYSWVAKASDNFDMCATWIYDYQL